MSLEDYKPSEEEIIRGSKPNYLYSHDFGKGRFFQVIHQDEFGFEIQFAPRTMFKVIYLKEKDDIEGIEIIKLVNEKEKQKVTLSKFNFAQLKAFLQFLSDIDLKGISQRRLRLLEGEDLDEETTKKIKTLLSKEGGADIIESLINDGIISSHDIVNTGFRKRGLSIFERLLNEFGYWKQYVDDNNLKSTKEEKAWQYFFQKNEWIFGYGLDYRFKEILQKEAHVSDNEIDGSNTVITDFLLGDSMFTTFVELKKPSTLLFGNNKNRSNSWTLSDELINAVCQILEHKASGQIKLDKGQYDGFGNLIKQKAYDSKVILIIGNWNELTHSKSDLELEIKKKTFELYRRDSRNIEIVTFDELFERAKFIVEGSESEKTENQTDDLPF
jgi:hypothetical protein